MTAGERRSAAAGWAVLIGWVVAWDTVATRHGFESLSATWRRWRRTNPLAGGSLDAASDWLDRHLTQ